MCGRFNKLNECYEYLSIIYSICVIIIVYLLSTLNYYVVYIQKGKSIILI